MYQKRKGTSVDRHSSTQSSISSSVVNRASRSRVQFSSRAQNCFLCFQVIEFSFLFNEKLKRQRISFQSACEQALKWSGVKKESHFISCQVQQCLEHFPYSVITWLKRGPFSLSFDWLNHLSASCLFAQLQPYTKEIVIQCTVVAIP